MKDVQHRRRYTVVNFVSVINVVLSVWEVIDGISQSDLIFLELHFSFFFRFFV